MNKYEDKNNEKSVLIFVLLACVAISIFWMLSYENTFTVDDINNIVIARYHSYTELFSFFPSRGYSNRSIPFMFLKVLNDLFGNYAQGYHIVYAMIHFINVYLVFRSTQILFRDLGIRQKLYGALISSIIFGAYQVSLLNILCISGVFDLVCCMFVLLCIFFYLKYKHENLYSAYYAGISVLFYYFALRSKEMAIILPIILLLYELYDGYKNNKIEISKYIAVMLGIMILFTAFHKVVDIKSSVETDQYYRNANPFSMLYVFIKYLFLYFDVQNGNYVYNGLTISSICGSIFFGIVIIYSIYSFFLKQDKSLFFVILTILVSMLTILPIVNTQHRLSLYIPSVFIALSISLFLIKITEIKQNVNLASVYFALAVFIYLLNFSSGTISFKNMSIAKCKNDNMDYLSIIKLKKPEENSNIYITGNGEEYDFFRSGYGNSFKLIFDDPSYNVEFVEKYPESPKYPYLYLEYTKGNIKEMERSESIDLKIIQIYPSVIKNNSNEDINIGIELNFINENQTIYVNGFSMPTTIGDNFISTTLTKEMIQENVEFVVEVKDIISKKISNAIILPIE